MTEEDTPWARMWANINRAREELWDAEAKAQEVFFTDLRRALEEYARKVDPDGFDEYGQPR